ncbi:WGR domain-containing protein [Methylobacter sp. G7]|uniref:WGR domain-containing protein n=1 Tax=Methylobacter sp. G7 TaxID=3230117 RepID=UPI003D809553
MFVSPGLFDDWSLIKKWGRVGSTDSTVRNDLFDTQEEAITERNKLCTAKCKKGYHTLRVDK